jgi:MFS transporter, PPP family, 3-phenylpropionic acid transporter
MSLLPIRLFYLSMFAGLGTVIPYMSVYLKANGLSGTQIGLVYMVQALVAVVAAPIIGRFADRARRPEWILVSGLLLAAASGIVLGTLSSIVVIMIGSIVLRTGTDAALPLADGLAVRQAKNHGKVSYGGIRNFGSAGWILTAPIVGLIAQRVGMSFLFWLFAAAMAIAIVLILRASRASPSPEIAGPPAPTRAAAATETLKHVFGNRTLVLSAAAVFVHGLFRHAIFRFEPIYLESLGVQLAGIGATASIPAVVELISMPLAGRIAARRGPATVIAMGIVISMVRVATVALWPVPAVVVATKILDGAGYGFELIGVVELVARQSQGDRLRATMALFTVSLAQIIGMVGNPIAGVVYDLAGARPLYLLSLGGSAIGALIIILAVVRHGPGHQP